MDLIRWRESYENEVPDMNEQHKTLVQMINKAYVIVRNHREEAHLALQFFYEVKEYALRHLQEEEALMERYEYPEFEEHKRAHGLFLRKLDEFQHRIALSDPTVIREIYAFLRYWMMEHTLEMDKRYGAFVREKMEMETAAAKPLLN